MTGASNIIKTAISQPVSSDVSADRVGSGSNTAGKVMLSIIKQPSLLFM